MSDTTIIHHLERHAASRGTQPALHDKLTGAWRTTTWSQYNKTTRQVARALLARGLESGAVVTILGSNRPEWVIAALGAMRIGGVSAGIYTSCSADEIGYILEHSESPLLIVENDEQLSRVAAVWGSIPTLQTVVVLDDFSERDDDRIVSWDDFLASGEAIEQSLVDEKLEALDGQDIADFIYTSGTTGPPKAVMLTHENLLWTATQLGHSVNLRQDEVALSYLPLSHIAEQTSSILMALVFGYEVYFCHDGLQLAAYLKEVRPTTFFGVPRVWERFEAGIKGQLAAATGAKARIAAMAQSVGSKMVAEQNAGRTPSGALRRQYAIADKLVFSKIHAAIGLDRCRILVSGAAPIPAASLEFFASVGLAVTELYGQSEDTGPTTTNLPGANRFGTVGRALDGVDVRIAQDGEILVRGKNVFVGYFKNEAATAETLVDGWLHSGDLGAIDDDGYLSIIGRKKDIIITSGGKNIAPQNIEEALSSIDIVGTSVVIGEKQRFLVALLTLEPEAAGRFADARGLTFDTMHEDATVRAHLEDRIKADVNPLMARVEHVRNFVVLPREFTTATGELTPTFKVKRNVVNEMYASEIAAVYEAGQAL